jgi:ABC-type microcin C transport system permease subunit YejE
MRKKEVRYHFLSLQTLVRASKLPGRRVEFIKTARTLSAYQHSKLHI